MNRSVRLTLVVLLLVVASIFSFVVYRQMNVAGEEALTNENGETVTRVDLEGHADNIVSFAYTGDPWLSTTITG